MKLWREKEIPVVQPQCSEAVDLWAELAAARNLDPDRYIEIRNELILKYEYLVLAAARKLSQFNRHLSVDEMRSLGFEGLVRSVERFDTAKGNSFSTFAYIRIRGSILDHIRTLSDNSRLYASRIKNVRLLEQTLGHTPTDEEIQESLGYKRLIDNTPQRLDDGVRGMRLSDSLEASSRIGNGIDEAKYLLNGLNKRERLVVIMYFWEGHTMKQIGADLGLSESRISQMMTNLIPRIRDNFERAA
jgi:RNA polymerase sigma factor FliA